MREKYVVCLEVPRPERENVEGARLYIKDAIQYQLYISEDCSEDFFSVSHVDNNPLLSKTGDKSMDKKYLSFSLFLYVTLTIALIVFVIKWWSLKIVTVVLLTGFSIIMKAISKEAGEEYKNRHGEDAFK